MPKRNEKEIIALLAAIESGEFIVYQDTGIKDLCEAFPDINAKCQNPKYSNNLVSWWWKEKKKILLLPRLSTLGPSKPLPRSNPPAPEEPDSYPTPPGRYVLFCFSAVVWASGESP